MQDSDMINGIPLVLFVIAAVEFMKLVGFSGKSLVWLSLAFGTLTGLGYQLLYKGLEPTPANIFAAAIYGLTVGFMATGTYKAAQSISKTPLG